MDVKLNEKNNFLDGDQVMDANEVAEFLKVSVSAVRRWTREGDLKGCKLRGKGDWRYLKSDVIRFFYGPGD